MFWNEFFIDPSATEEWNLSRMAREAAKRSSSRLGADRRSRLVNYRAIMRAKRVVLEALAEACDAHEIRRGELQRFLRQRPEISDYAKFRASCERHGIPWTRWPARLREGRVQTRDFDDAAFRYHTYVQWVAEQQLAAAAHASGENRGLYLDLPLGVNPAGYDTWRERDAFLTGLSAGAPPDPFFTKGQKWGLPPLNPHGLRRGGYRHLAACLRHHMRHAALLRIDHIMGFHRVFCVPQDADATEGVYVQYPAEEFYAVLKIESHRARCAVAGEDLGTVPGGVRTSMRRHGIDRLYVMQFSFDGKRVGTPPADSVASLNTHDMAPFAGFYCGKDIAYRVDLGLMTHDAAKAESRGRLGMRRALTAYLRREGLLAGRTASVPAKSAMRALLRFLAKSPAAVVLINLEDLWGEIEQQNTPGTTSERVNWRRRAAKSFEEFANDPAVLKILREIDGMRGERMTK
jgi:4-alpha-glucanotransferase